MGVYVKGMEMPKDKYRCPFWNVDHICLANIMGIVCDTTESTCIPDNCPMVEIPEPHGRLIDADVALENIDMADGGPCYVGKEGIDNTPTIIEAEDE